MEFELHLFNNDTSSKSGGGRIIRLRALDGREAHTWIDALHARRARLWGLPPPQPVLAPR
jgi:hypothetical protein